MKIFLKITIVALVNVLAVRSFCLESIDSIIDEGLSRIHAHFSKDNEQSLRIIVKPITYENTKIGGKFAGYLQGHIKTCISSHQFLQLVSDDSIKFFEAMNEIKESNKDTYDDQISLKAGLLRSAQAYISGEYWPHESYVELILDGYLLETRESFSTAINLPRDLLPGHLPFAPAETQQIKEKIEFVDRITSKIGDLKVRVWANKGDGGTYKLGEPIFFYVQANQDCYLRLYYIDALNDGYLLYPRNYSRHNDFIEKGEIYSIPDEVQYNNDFYFEASQPIGTDIIKAVASTEPFAETIEEFKLKAQNHNFLRRELIRGIKTVERGQKAEDMCIISIIE